MKIENLKSQKAKIELHQISSIGNRNGEKEGFET